MVNGQGKIKIVMGDGVEIEVEEGDRIVAQINNLKNAEREARFTTDRENFRNDAAQAVTSLIEEEDLEDALYGMTLVLALDGETQPVLTESSKVVLKVRKPRQKKEKATNS